MSDLTKPRTNDELFLAAISGDYTGSLPKPLTRVQEYLEKIAKNGTGGETVDLSEYAKKEELLEIEKDVGKLLNDSTRHVHTNMQSLMEITAADITALHETFPYQIYVLQQSLGDIQTTLENIVGVSE